MVVAGPRLRRSLLAAVAADWPSGGSPRARRQVATYRVRGTRVGDRARRRDRRRRDRRRRVDGRRGPADRRVRVRAPARADPRGSPATCCGSRSRCPDTVIGTCHARVPDRVRDNVQVNVAHHRAGACAITGLNGSARIQTGSGAIAVDGFCGFQLSATSASGDVARRRRLLARPRWSCAPAAATCTPSCPPAATASTPTATRGSADVRNLTVTDDAPFAVQAISGTGDVLVEGRG